MKLIVTTKTKVITDIWWIAVDPSDCGIWSYLELRKCDVSERLTVDVPDWKSQGWRIAKLRITEIP